MFSRKIHTLRRIYAQCSSARLNALLAPPKNAGLGCWVLL